MFKGTLIDHSGRLIILSSVEYIEKIEDNTCYGLRVNMISGNQFTIIESSDRDLVDHVWEQLIRWSPENSVHPNFNINDIIMSYNILHKG